MNQNIDLYHYSISSYLEKIDNLQVDNLPENFVIEEAYIDADNYEEKDNNIVMRFEIKISNNLSLAEIYLKLEKPKNISSVYLDKCGHPVPIALNQTNINNYCKYGFSIKIHQNKLELETKVLISANTYPSQWTFEYEDIKSNWKSFVLDLESDPGLHGVTASAFVEWRSPRMGSNNPTKIESNVWEWLVRSKLEAYFAAKKVNVPTTYKEGPTWSFYRFGQSITLLANGNLVFIAGEHEDWSDSDFCIYNDVIVVKPNNTIEFYCYSKSDFTQTDFHTATLVKNKIIIIGNLGYSKDRTEKTQVYALDLSSYKMEKINTSGLSPGWIHKHTSNLSSDKKSIIIKGGLLHLDSKHSLRENIDDWKLDLNDWRWERTSDRKWTRWQIYRHDQKHMNFFEIRLTLWSLEDDDESHNSKELEELEKKLGYLPDILLMKELYTFDLTKEALQEDNWNIFWTHINDVKVKFVERDECLQVTVEGSLSNEIIETLKKCLLDRLSVLQNTTCEIENYRFSTYN